jgi:hypothetical protein
MLGTIFNNKFDQGSSSFIFLVIFLILFTGQMIDQGQIHQLSTAIGIQHAIKVNLIERHTRSKFICIFGFFCVTASGSFKVPLKIIRVSDQFNDNGR